MDTVIGFIRKHLTWLLLAAMGLGLLKGHFAPMEFSRAICATAAFIMLYPVMVNFRLEEGLKHLGGVGRVLGISLAVNFVVSPLIAVGLAWVALRSEPLAAAGLLLIGAVPASGMAIGWLNQFKANVHLGLVLVAANILATFVIVPLLMPVALEHLFHASIEVGSLVIIEKLAFVVLIPLTLGWLTRVVLRRLGRGGLPAKHKELLGGVSNFGILLVMFLIMSLKDSQSVLSHQDVALLAVPAVAAYYGLMYLVVTRVIRHALAPVEALPFFVTTFLRFHVISLGITISAFAGLEKGIFAAVPIIVGFLLQPALASALGQRIARQNRPPAALEPARA
jgi:ACR3 family arsenite efflux pump ArsB